MMKNVIRGVKMLLLFNLIVLTYSCNEDEEVVLSDENFITSFKLTSGNYEQNFEIQQNTIQGETPYFVSEQGLALTVLISDKASISPNPATITSLEELTDFTITAENGEKRTYSIGINRELFDKNEIVSFTLKSGEYEEDFEVVENEISGRAPHYIDDEDVTLTIEVSKHATITPDPGTVKSIVDPITFTVTAENGDEQNFTVDIKREISPEKKLLSFEIDTDFFKKSLDIDEENGTVFQRVLPDVDLMSLTATVTISNRATISPDPETISDYTNPVVFTVTAENGDTKEYTVTLEKMDMDFETGCEDSNLIKWFGGDDREADPAFPNAFRPRNVGEGQTISLEKDMYPTLFGVFFDGPFASARTNEVYTDDIEINLDIRDEDGAIIKSTSAIITAPFGGGRVDFDISSLNLLLEGKKTYYFTWYLVDGERLGINSGALGNTNEGITGICGSGGFCATSRIEENTSLSDWSIWVRWTANFNFKLIGKQ